MTRTTAQTIFNILVEECGIPLDDRDRFMEAYDQPIKEIIPLVFKFDGKWSGFGTRINYDSKGVWIEPYNDTSVNRTACKKANMRLGPLSEEKRLFR